MQIYDKPLGWLTPYENNPRNNDEAVEPVANSISEFGFKVPIVATSDGEIINGHTRWKAAKKLKLKTVPVIIADDLTEEQVRAFRLADNKVAEIAQWDIELLLSEIESVDNLDMTLFGFTDSDYTLDDFEDEETDTDISEDEIESEGDSVSSVEYGDIYQLGRHRLMCGDSTSAGDMKELIDGEKIDLYVTDPPSSIFYEDKPVRSDIHPTMKPLKLIARCVLNSTKKGERVLDSFNGGGSTLMVCEKTERIYYGMELDPIYVERTIKRWEEETGLKAEKIN